jgi:3-deoxy-D-manno-octulosonate 8-phosphate phosphatase KdsC-like HAD superfamily phosphatase
MTAHGMTVKVSSIHVNGWFGSHDKLSTSLGMLERAFDCARSAAAHRFAYIGDSPNDEPMFRHFDCSVGVANVVDFAGRMQTLPRFVTGARSGSGFAEFARRIVGSLSAP